MTQDDLGDHLNSGRAPTGRAGRVLLGSVAGRPLELAWEQRAAEVIRFADYPANVARGPGAPERPAAQLRDAALIGQLLLGGRPLALTLDAETTTLGNISTRTSTSRAQGGWLRCEELLELLEGEPPQSGSPLRFRGQVEIPGHGSDDVTLEIEVEPVAGRALLRYRKLVDRTT